MSVSLPHRQVFDGPEKRLRARSKGWPDAIMGGPSGRPGERLRRYCGADPLVADRDYRAGSDEPATRSHMRPPFASGLAGQRARSICVLREEVVAMVRSAKNVLTSCRLEVVRSGHGFLFRPGRVHAFTIGSG